MHGDDHGRREQDFTPNTPNPNTPRTATITGDASKTADGTTTLAIRLDEHVQLRIELPNCLGEDINMLELLALVDGVRRWGPRLRGYHLVCGCDGMAPGEARPAPHGSWSRRIAGGGS